MSTLPIWLKSADKAGEVRCVLTLHVQPGAKKTEIAGEHGEALKIRLAAPPVEGKANAALLAFLAKRLAVPKSALALLSGDTSRHKRIEVALDATAVATLLG